MDHKRDFNDKQQYPFLTGYWPDPNTSPNLDQENTTYLQELIGILFWTIALGRVDKTIEGSVLSRHLDFLNQRYLDQHFNIFAYLKHHQNSKLVMSPKRMYLGEKLIYHSRVMRSGSSSLEKLKRILLSMPIPLMENIWRPMHGLIQT